MHITTNIGCQIESKTDIKYNCRNCSNNFCVQCINNKENKTEKNVTHSATKRKRKPRTNDKENRKEKNVTHSSTKRTRKKMHTNNNDINAPPKKKQKQNNCNKEQVHYQDEDKDEDEDEDQEEDEDEDEDLLPLTQHMAKKEKMYEKEILDLQQIKLHYNSRLKQLKKQQKESNDELELENVHLRKNLIKKEKTIKKLKLKNQQLTTELNKKQAILNNIRTDLDNQ